jgi:hypothetical protein
MTVTICTDSDGRVQAVIVPEGACATVIKTDEDSDGTYVAARYGEGENEIVLRYDPERDAGMREEVPRGYRSRQGLTIHRLERGLNS